MIIKYLIILVTIFMPVTLSFEIKIRSTSRYGNVSVIIILLFIIKDSANCKLVRGMEQTSIMSVCTD